MSRILLEPAYKILHTSVEFKRRTISVTPFRLLHQADLAISCFHIMFLPELTERLSRLLKTDRASLLTDEVEDIERNLTVDTRRNCEQVWLADQSALNRSFNRVLGESPSEWRRSRIGHH